MTATIEEKDFKEIYEQTYLGTLKYIAIKCNRIEDINDILQDTYIEFFRILKKKRNLNVETSQSYINGIASNIIKRHYAKKKKEVILMSLVNEENEEIDVADTFDLEQDFIVKQDAQEIFDFIKTKDRITAKVFYFYFIFGMKISEVAKELNLQESNVKNKIYRTVKEMKVRFGKDGGENGK